MCACRRAYASRPGRMGCRPEFARARSPELDLLGGHCPALLTALRTPPARRSRRRWRARGRIAHDRPRTHPRARAGTGRLLGHGTSRDSSTRGTGGRRATTVRLRTRDSRLRPVRLRPAPNLRTPAPAPSQARRRLASVALPGSELLPAGPGGTMGSLMSGSLRLEFPIRPGGHHDAEGSRAPRGETGGAMFSQSLKGVEAPRRVDDPRAPAPTMPRKSDPMIAPGS
jgi:hypothetical protein